MGAHNLLILSDVHLGSDLIHWAQPGAPIRARASLRRDQDLIELLDWYRAHRTSGQPWRLVIAGDLLDLVGMSVSPDGHDGVTPPNAEERAHGLGSAADHTVVKLWQVAEHHAPVFAALARFVAAGNALVVVRGNHDLDLHWEAVQVEFTRVLARHATFDPAQIEFAPWFYYERDVIYVEHGHQYDAFCSVEHLLHPVSPRDPRRTLLSCADVLLRYIVRPTRGLTEGGHSERTFVGYLRFAARLGSREMGRLGQRFVHAVVALIGMWRDHFGEASSWVRREHERKMRLLGLAKQISLARLHALARLQHPPVTRSLLAILASVMLDRVVVGACAILACILLGQRAETWWQAVVPIVGVLVLMSFAAFAWRKLRSAVDPSSDLRECAPRVARLFPAAFVVMGHTHLPEMRPLPAGTTTYVNLGAWTEDETEEGQAPALPATRTHLVVVGSEQGPVGELLIWDSELGPQRLASSLAHPSTVPPRAPSA